MSTTSPFPTRRPMNPVPPPNRHTAREWDEIRRAFCSSILVDTSLNSLAQNLEGRDWPVKGPDEKPSAYLDLEFSELVEMLALRGQPPSVADQLIDILKETLSFDDPFGDMVVQTPEVVAAENPLSKNLVKLKINPEFPVGLTALTPETLAFCKLEKITTLGEFALTAQRMAGSVVVGGDFRALLNALSHVDERTIARFLPFRVGDKGLHYMEGLAQAVAAQPEAVQASLAAGLGFGLSKKQQELAATVSREASLAARTVINERAAELRKYCDEDHAALVKSIADGASPRSLVAILANPVVEAVVADMITPVSAKTEKSGGGFFGKLFGWGRK